MNTYERAKNIGAVHFSAVAIFMALVFWAYSFGTPGSVPSAADIAKVLAVSLLLLCSADSIPFPASWNENASRKASWNGLIVLGLLALLAGVACLPVAFKILFLSLLILSGVLLCVRSFYRYFHAPSSPPWVRLFLFILALWCSAIAWGRAFLNPSFLRVLTLGLAQKDTLYHMAISNMLKTYGIPTTGLHGTPRLVYHVGSHWYFAQLSKLLDIPVVWVYNLAFPIIFIPLCLHGFFSLVLSLRCSNDMPMEDMGGSSFWGLLCIAIVGFIPYLPELGTGTYMNLIDNEHIGISESYNVGLTLGLLALSLIYPFLHARRSENSERKSLWPLLVFPVVIALIGIVKISLMDILSVLWIYGLVRWPARQKIWGLASLVLLLASDWKVLHYFQLNMPVSWSLWHFVRTYIGVTWIPYSLVMPVMWSLGFIVLTLFADEATSWKLIVRQWRADRLFDVEWVAIIAVFSVAPSIFLSIPENVVTAYYLNVQGWVGPAFLLGFWPVLSAVLKKPTTSLGKALFQGAAVILIATTALNAAWPVLGLWNDKRSMQYVLRPEPAVTAQGVVLRYADTVSILMQLDKIPLEEKRRTRLFIPQSNRSYWDLFKLQNGRIDAAPFVAPALSGLAMIYGVPTNAGTSYNYDAYPVIGPTPTTVPGLCSTVRDQHADRLIIFTGVMPRPVFRYLCNQTPVPAQS